MERVYRSVLIIILGTGILSLRDLRIRVPPAVIRGDDALLECFYELESDQLYSIKWYRGTTEFFRYTPKETPQMKQFRNPFSGIRVREEASNATRVVLEHVPRNITGQFSCEVTADQPSFFTDVQSAYLHVVDLPKQNPYILGLKTRYRIGENLKANCTSEHGNPAANLSWYINGAPVDHAGYVHTHHRKFDGHFFTVSSVLRLTISKQLFERGHLKIRCVAQMFNIYHRSHEKSVELERKRHRHHYRSTTSTTPLPSQWNLVERYPETTLIFQSSLNSGVCNLQEFAIIFIPFVAIFR